MASKIEPSAPHFDSVPDVSHSAETFIAEKRIGERIRRLRLKRSMGLVELGRHAGLSASFLSQLETGRVVPTLRNLARIAMVFGRDLSYFFEPEPHPLFRRIGVPSASACPSPASMTRLTTSRAWRIWFQTASSTRISPSLCPSEKRRK